MPTQTNKEAIKSTVPSSVSDSLKKLTEKHNSKTKKNKNKSICLLNISVFVFDIFSPSFFGSLYHSYANKSSHSLVYHPQLVAVSFLVKYSAYAQYEIIHCVNCEILLPLVAM